MYEFPYGPRDRQVLLDRSNLVNRCSIDILWPAGLPICSYRQRAQYRDQMIRGVDYARLLNERAIRLGTNIEGGFKRSCVPPIDLVQALDREVLDVLRWSVILGCAVIKYLVRR